MRFFLSSLPIMLECEQNRTPNWLIGGSMSRAQRPSTPDKKRRIQFEFSRTLVDEIDRLVKDLDVSSRGEVIRLALGLLKVAAHGRTRGARVILEEGEVRTEVVLPIATRMKQ